MTTPITELAPADARRILAALRWEPSIDLLSSVLTDGEYDYATAVDRGEAAQVEAEVRALLDAVAALPDADGDTLECERCGAPMAADASHVVHVAADYALNICGDCAGRDMPAVSGAAEDRYNIGW